MSDSLGYHGLQHARLPCPSHLPEFSNSSPLSQWCHPTMLSSSAFFCLQSFPASGSFAVSQPFPSGGQSIGASDSASVFPVNSQGRFPLGLTSLISLLPRDSQESSPRPQFEGIKFLALSLLYDPTLSNVHDYCKKQSLDNMDLCQKSNVSVF